MPIYEFRHPVTGEVFEKSLPMSEAGKPFVCEDGAVAEQLVSAPCIAIVQGGTNACRDAR